MKYSLPIPRSFRSSFLVAGLFCLLAVLLIGQAGAQAVSPTVGDTNPEDQPLIGQQLGSNLTLNQNVGATVAENESFDRYGVGLQAEGGAQTNFFGTKTDHTTVGYMSFAGDAALNLRTPRTSYFVLYQPKYTVYPQYTRVNNYGQTFFQSLDHAISEHLGVGWDVTASRYLSLDQFLPQTLGIGGIGIVVPNVQSVLLENSYQVTNAATSLRLRYLMSARMTFTAALTGAFFLSVPFDLTPTTGLTSQRFLTGGADLRLDYQLNMHDSIGAELTPIYLSGLSPKGHLVAEVVQATYRRQLTSATSVAVAAGPLFYQTSIPGFASLQNNSYALNGSLSRQIRQSQVSVAYSRAFIASFLSPPIVSHSIGLNAYVPLQRRWILTSAASYIHEASVARPGASIYGGTLYGGSAQIAYQFGSKAQLYGIYSFRSQDLAYGQSQSNTFYQNKFGIGIRFNLGNPTTNGGMQ